MQEASMLGIMWVRSKCNDFQGIQNRLWIHYWGAVVSSKTVKSNTASAGAPLRCIHEDTFWTPHSNLGWGEEEIEKMSKLESDLFVYGVDESTLDLDVIENDFNTFTNLDDIVDYIWSTILVGSKNRFSYD